MTKHLSRLLLASAAVLTIATAANAADLIAGADPIYDSALFNFEGFYIGATAGIGAFPGPGVVGTVGVVAGANFELSDAILAGVEFQGDALWTGAGFVGFDTLFLAKLGTYLSDSIMIYGNAGAGWVANVPSYALGLGLEFAMTDNLSLRGEAMATGTFGVWPDGGKATIGLLFHVN